MSYMNNEYDQIYEEVREMGSVFDVEVSALTLRPQIFFVECVLDFRVLPVFSLEPLVYLPLKLYHGKPIKICARMIFCKKHPHLLVGRFLESSRCNSALIPLGIKRGRIDCYGM